MIRAPIHTKRITAGIAGAGSSVVADILAKRSQQVADSSRSNCRLGHHRALHPVVALLGRERGHDPAITQHSHMTAIAIVVRPFDALDIIKAKLVIPGHRALPGHQRHIALHGADLHSGDAQYKGTGPNVRDRHAKHRGWHAQAAPPAIKRLEQSLRMTQLPSAVPTMAMTWPLP